MSGYRSDPDGRLNFTTYYVQIYGDSAVGAPDTRLPPPLQHLAPRDFEIALPIDKVQSIGLFDLTAYAEFSRRLPENQIAGQGPAQARVITDGDDTSG